MFYTFQNSGIRTTFMIDVPDKEVISVQIKSSDLKELNKDMLRHSTCMYKVDIELPMNYDAHALYWYEISYVTLVWYKKEIKTEKVIIGEKRVHRDMLDKKSSILLHLLDIVKYLPDYYSEADLCMQIEDVCSKSYNSDTEEIVRILLLSDIMHSSRYIVRFAFVIGFICRHALTVVHKLINANTAHEILDALLQKKLENYPQSCSDYMPSLCKQLLQIAYGNRLCTLLFLNRAFPFLSENLLVKLVQQSSLLTEKLVNEEPYCYELSENLCSKFLTNYLETENIHSKKILEYLYQYLPLEMSLPCFEKLILLNDTEERTEREEDIHTTITASIKYQILAFLKKTIREKSIVQLLKMATAIGRYGFYKDKEMCSSVEQGIFSCFSFYSLKEEVTKQEFEDFLNLTGCFIDLETQLQLLKSMSESKNSSVRRLFLLLNEDDFLPQAYKCAQSDVFTSLLQNEIKTTQTRNGDDILPTFYTYCSILKLPVVLKREEVQQALESVVSKWLNSYTLRELMLHVDKVEQLCEKEPAVLVLYKTYVLGHFQKKGVTPSEVVLMWCTHGSLRVNSK